MKKPCYLSKHYILAFPPLYWRLKMVLKYMPDLYDLLVTEMISGKHSRESRLTFENYHSLRVDLEAGANTADQAAIAAAEAALDISDDANYYAKAREYEAENARFVKKTAKKTSDAEAAAAALGAHAPLAGPPGDATASGGGAVPTGAADAAADAAGAALAPAEESADYTFLTKHFNLAHFKAFFRYKNVCKYDTVGRKDGPIREILTAFSMIEFLDFVTTFDLRNNASAKKKLSELMAPPEAEQEGEDDLEDPALEAIAGEGEEEQANSA